MQIQKQIEEAMPRLRAEIAGAVARGYCYVENSKKVLDPDLLKAMGKELEMLFKKELSTIATKSADQAVLNYILSLGWQDTENEYVKEVLSDAEKLAQALSKPKE